ncbi:MAG TPA: class I SAM-dependent methyltransferase [Solirubrobacteraceae bacterium]
MSAAPEVAAPGGGVTEKVARLLDERVFRGGLSRVLDERRLRRGAREVVDREGLPPARELDVAPLELLRSADLETLRDPERLERDILPALGLNDEELDEFPRELYEFCGRGLRHWQYPNQFGPYLATLAGQPISSYLEVGVRHGGTFLITVEYLSRFRPLRKALAMDVVDSPWLRGQLKGRAGMRMVLADSQMPQFGWVLAREGPFDLALVDAAHHESTAQSDLEAVRPHANIVVLHDVVSQACPGVGTVWRRFRDEETADWDFLEFTAQYDDVVQRMGGPYLGIGVAIRKTRLPAG